MGQSRQPKPTGTIAQRLRAVEERLVGSARFRDLRLDLAIWQDGDDRRKIPTGDPNRPWDYVYPDDVPAWQLSLDFGGAPKPGTQLPLFVPQAAHDARLAWQLARLAIPFGADKVRRVELADPEAPLPETRWRWAPVAGAEVTGEEWREGAR